MDELNQFKIFRPVNPLFFVLVSFISSPNILNAANNQALVDHKTDGDNIVGQLPVDFFTLPEDNWQSSRNPQTSKFFDGVNHLLPFRHERSVGAALASLDRILAATSEALDKSKDVIGQKKAILAGDKPSRWVPWHLNQLMLRLGINQIGTIGIMTAISQTSTDVFWSRRPEHAVSLGLSRSKKNPVADVDEPHGMQIQFDDSTTDSGLNLLIDPIVNIVMSTKRVDDESLLRDGLKAVAKNMQTLMDSSAYVYDAPWLPQTYRVDIWVEGSGRVTPTAFAGAILRVRLDWNRRSGRTLDRRPPEGEGARNLANLFKTLGHDFEKARESGDHNFHLYQILVGIGMYGEGRFGVVRGSLGVLGYVLFARQQSASNKQWASSSGLNHVPLIESYPQVSHLAFAENRRLTYEYSRGASGVIERVLYRVSREKFRSGLEKSARWADMIAERSDKNSGSKWLVTELRPSFFFSIEGATPVATLGGIAAIEFRLRRSGANI